MPNKLGLGSLRTFLGRATRPWRRWCERGLALVLGASLLLWQLSRLSGQGALVRVAHDEVGLVLDLVRGTTRLVDSPGVVVHLPWFQQVVRFPRAPLQLTFVGNSAADHARGPRLGVRTRDGSSAWFDGLSLRYALLPGDASGALKALGPRLVRSHEFVHPFARAALRDALGAHTPEELMDPRHLLEATDQVRQVLGANLAALGMTVLDVALCKPSFAAQFEAVLERRKVGEQELAGLASRRQVLRQEREQLVERKKKEIAMARQALESKLEIEQLQAEREARRLRSETDLYFAQRTQEGQIRRQTSEIEAASLQLQIEHEAQGFRATLDALSSQGELAVRQALVQRLASIHFRLAPAKEALPSGASEIAKAP